MCCNPGRGKKPGNGNAGKGRDPEQKEVHKRYRPERNEKNCEGVKLLKDTVGMQKRMRGLGKRNLRKRETRAFRGVVKKGLTRKRLCCRDLQKKKEVMKEI